LDVTSLYIFIKAAQYAVYSKEPNIRLRTFPVAVRNKENSLTFQNRVGCQDLRF